MRTSLSCSERGRPAIAPWRLALVTVIQFAEGLSDRQAAEAVRARMDRKYALGLERTDPGFDFSVLSEFRVRLVEGGSEHLLLESLLKACKERGYLKARGRQRPDSTYVLGALHILSRLERAAEAVRAALRTPWRRQLQSRCESTPIPNSSRDTQSVSKATDYPRARKPGWST
jgi:Transposase domain (DUF772)